MLGDRLRALRHQHGLTLRQVADATGLSTALLSQIENGRTDPSVTTLRKLARVFEADMASLFRDPDAPAVHVSRPGERFRMAAPAGLITYERITPGRGDFEVLRAELAPGDVSSEHAWGHDSTECVYVLTGEVVVEVGAQTHHLGAGDAVTFDSREPHRYANTSGAPASFLLTVSPPTP
ncbi:cupin domain-containing protein [Cellulomonas shaoxiangyii]|uniref:Cupin domain-containing protein n=1 Tax=Cellulomonas shaoxiangyii TaxID=2566013 RepID=A0A4P7SFK4_9CELL|nr:cupin domain-containing protein [Cellulomonas shaoxiangyii]QCB92680.1 cupin domain-containing protein [Cellulomonas shaoxiangyii]TGY83423.1 cupin domain-containing protein [Cellulomonas shaoxiangyii]